MESLINFMSCVNSAWLLAVTGVAFVVYVGISFCVEAFRKAQADRYAREMRERIGFKETNV